ncbi:MAG: glutamine-hydrolyzing GMP synthase [Candidatus Korarchaeum sp.]|nr:glutamine-hydrolyzing GMP synthase [Candidatus Korarchaeum sp.]MDW8035854.1 glutamine-hydrolyzing GMP synthase [Candidatus Korarchaeum sp.]
MILVVNFGGQYAHLIARKVRDLGVYSEIIPYTKASYEEVNTRRPAGIILSGGPSSVYEPNSPSLDPRLLDMGLPILGICYGFQLIVKLLGGEVRRGKGEFGPTEVQLVEEDELLMGWDGGLVWMSHSDFVSKLPDDLIVTSVSENGYVSSFKHKRKPIYGVQFHPEVKHTQGGIKILENFLKIARAERDWDTERILSMIEDYLIEEVSKCSKVLVAVSGGVDSTLSALLVSRVAKGKLVPVFVNHGLLRKGEPESVVSSLRKIGIDVIYVDASKEFLEALRGVRGCEEKRAIVGELFAKIFMDIFERENCDCLVQGTLYPDVIESGAEVGADRIKSHHNVAGLPSWFKGRVIEPLRYLYKDEVRRLARRLGVPEEIVSKHPFPGPGLSVRIIGEITEEKLDIVREASSIVEDALRERGLYDKVWQAFAVIGEDRWVGIKGDARVDGYIVTVRVVESEDAMTADWFRLDQETLEELSKRISAIPQVSMITYAITTKPPSTIEPC